VRGRKLGALTLVQAESERRFDHADLVFVQQLATTAASALDNARLYEEQWRTAHTLQAALLPTDLPAVPGLRLAARYRSPADADVLVGGDLYDVVPEPDGCGVVVADVCGKGAAAAALTALIRHTVRAEIDHGHGPAMVLERLNRAMLRASGGRPGRFATVAQARLTRTPTGVAVRLASAGHPPPLVVRDGRAVPVPAPGTLLGVYPDITLTEVTFDLHHGEIMVLYTDGVTEARNTEGLYGPERLARAVAAGGTADEVADRILADLDAFRHGQQRDDIAILVIEATT
jgi:serine phosphatase RsbU (regulator of sigma subunit)